MVIKLSVLATGAFSFAGVLFAELAAREGWVANG
jgi:hypothetical protein